MPANCIWEVQIGYLELSSVITVVLIRLNVMAGNEEFGVGKSLCLIVLIRVRSLGRTELLWRRRVVSKVGSDIPEGCGIRLMHF
jgi:hypothetical protein